MRKRIPLDGLVGTFVAAASLALLAWGGEASSRRPGALAAVLLVVAGASYAFHRRAPLGSFVVTLVAVSTYLALGYPGGAELPSLLAAVYALAASGRRWIAGCLTLGFVAVAVVYRVGVEGEEPLTVVVGSSVLLLVVLLGDGVHTRRALRDEARARLRMVAVEKEAEARARVAEERLRLAHELHDVMAHTITTMTVQAGAAIDLLDRDPSRAREPLEGMRAAAKDAMAELRSILEVLRLPDGAADRSPAKGLEHLAAVVQAVESAGLTVEVVDEGEGDRALPPSIDRACLRVIQEACTNTLRHAAARRVAIRLRYEPAVVVVEVVDDGDDGNASPAASGGGYGLVGLRERVEAMGGRLQAGRTEAGGFRVAATLPRVAGASG